MIKDKYIQKLEELNFYLSEFLRINHNRERDEEIIIRLSLESELSSLKAEMEKEYGYKIEINKPNSLLTGWVCPRCQIVHGPFTTSCGCPPPTITRSSTDATF